MLKKLVFLLVGLVIVIGGAAFFYLDALVKGGIEVVGTEVLGSEVTVSSVSISPLSGSGSIADLRIENPEGFNADYIFELGYVAVNINVDSIFSDVIEIDLVTIAQPRITYETLITTDNVRALLRQLPASDSGGESGGASKKIIIHELQLLDPQVTLSSVGVSATPVRLPDILLYDIGTEADAATVAEALRVVLGALSTAVLDADLPGVGNLRDKVDAEVERALDNLGDRLRSLGN